MVATLRRYASRSTRTLPEHGKQWTVSMVSSGRAAVVGELEGEPVHLQAEVLLPWDPMDLGSEGVLLSLAQQGNCTWVQPNA